MVYGLWSSEQPLLFVARKVEADIQFNRYNMYQDWGIQSSHIFIYIYLRYCVIFSYFRHQKLIAIT